MSESIRQYKYLWVLIIIYCFINTSSDLYDSKVIHILFLNSGSGVLLFSLTFFIIGIITYVYGYKTARLAIRTGIFYCALFALLCFISISILKITGNNQYSFVLYSTGKIFISTIITSFIAEHINAYIVNRIKSHFNNEYIGITLLLSIFISSGISMLIFCLLAFSWRMNNFKEFIVVTVSSWIYRFLTEIILVPFSSKLIRVIEKREFQKKSVDY